MSRSLRTLLVANDGFSTGHVVRMLAVGRALARRAEERGLTTSRLLITTSEAEPLLAGEPLAVLRLPAPVRARAAGWTDGERRRLLRDTIAAAVESIAPDLIVVDTFPGGPHGELAGLGRRGKRVLVRRAVLDPAAELLTTGLADYDLAILADDAGEPAALAPANAALPTVHVPPITLAAPAATRAEARRALELPAHGRCWLVTAGGGGDADAAGQVRTVAARLAAGTGDHVVLALGPLDVAPAALAGVTTRRVVPLQPWLAAFDGAIAAAGYNTAHELAAAGVPAALFALPRPFDDQAARARRLAASGAAHVLATLDDDALASAHHWLCHARPQPRACDGADRAALALLDLVLGGRA